MTFDPAPDEALEREPTLLPPPRRGQLGRLGEAAIAAISAARDTYGLFVRSLYYTVRGRKEPGAVMRQMYEIGNRSLVFVCIVMGFIGMILVYQGGLQTKRVVPDLSQLGATFLEVLVRDLGASICALMLATRVGAGIAAELGSMAVTEQIDALRLCAADPVDYLVKPRFLASVVMVLVLTVVSSSAAYATGMFGAQVFFGINPRTFVNFTLVDAVDVATGLTKCIAYGAAIPLISAQAGFAATRGSEGVGTATTHAVVRSSLAVIALDFLISGAFWVAFGGRLAMIAFQGIFKAFGTRRILDDVSFEAHRGEVLFVIGASGVGKSVLIKQVVGFIRPDAGEILVDGEAVTGLDERGFARVRKRCAMVFQHATLFDAMTCVENVALPLAKHRRLDQGQALSEARALLARVHVEAFAERYPGELGDGLRKRVAIARALALEPEVVLFDEPTTGLDPVNARRVDRLISELSEKAGVTSLVVSHDLTSIFTIAHRIVMLYKGKVRLIGSPEDFRESTDAVVRQFVRGEAQGPFET